MDIQGGPSSSVIFNVILNNFAFIQDIDLRHHLRAGSLKLFTEYKLFG